MRQALRIVIAEDDQDTRDMYRTSLTALGHEFVGEAANGRDLVAECEKLKPQLVISDIKMPDMDGIEAADLICKPEPLPIIFISGYYDEKLVQRAQLSHVFAYLVKPIKGGELATAIAVAMARFQELQAVRTEANTLRKALKDRKIVERAKGILMERAGLSEERAFARLQKLSWDTNQKLVKVAETIILAEDAVAPFQKRVDTAAKAEQPSARQGDGGQHYLGRGLRRRTSGEKS